MEYNRIVKKHGWYVADFNGAHFEMAALYGKYGVAVLVRRISVLAEKRYNPEKIYRVLEDKGVYNFD